MKTTKEIIGYKLKDEKYRKPSLMIAGMGQFFDQKKSDDFGDYCFEAGSWAQESLKKYDLLDLWFTPIYKEEPELNKWYKEKDVCGKEMIFYANKIEEDEDITGYGFCGGRRISRVRLSNERLEL